MGLRHTESRKLLELIFEQIQQPQFLVRRQGATDKAGCAGPRAKQAGFLDNGRQTRYTHTVPLASLRPFAGLRAGIPMP